MILMKSIDEIVVDLDLADWRTVGFGMNCSVSDKKKEKLRKKEHEKMLKENKSHIYKGVRYMKRTKEEYRKHFNKCAKKAFFKWYERLWL